ncbi:hypothetical protein [Sporohalobacter salinus]|uniref:hypothetical protein n=1 Tax=Sporohalobacter salinus TaxID=1494606 RepID=UPI001960A566|nr:hypothetical protein [Sporohalobacter salinus]MBM7623347.1 signal transduction histidine kinase [Sporohalobacter salinus]
MSTTLVWFYLFTVLTAAMILLVPPNRIKEFLSFGLIGGGLIAIILQFLGVNVFELWKFNAALISINKIPLGILFAWIPPTIIFGHFAYKINSFLKVVIYIAGFALITSIITYGSVLLGYRSYLNWSPYLDFLLAFITHLGLTYYLIYQQKLKFV